MMLRDVGRGQPRGVTPGGLARVGADAVPVCPVGRHLWQPRKGGADVQLAPQPGGLTASGALPLDHSRGLLRHGGLGVCGCGRGFKGP